MKMTKHKESIHRLSVIVPQNPFAPIQLQDRKHCLCALNVERLMEWWPGTPHSPHRDANKVRAIQRSLDWKRVAAIAAYLLQDEVVDAPDAIDKYFRQIYQTKLHEPGREWPPKISRVVGYERSEFPMFSNILVHVNGAKIEDIDIPNEHGAARLSFDENDKKLNFSVIDGQHRINGAYLAVKILKETNPKAVWEIPAEIFIDLDPPDEPPRRQAQIFIDVNFYQKKVDRSLVADLFPTARAHRKALNYKERAQDIGRKLMLEYGPLVGMIQIPGIKYGVKDVITLATLNSAVEDILEYLEAKDYTGLEEQSQLISKCLEAWLIASGRMEEVTDGNKGLSSQNVVYQGRVLISVIALIPAMIWKLEESKTDIVTTKAKQLLIEWLKELIAKANLSEKGKFLSKDSFKERGYLGSGGIAKFRDTLWAAVDGKSKIISSTPLEQIQARAAKNRSDVIDAIFGEE